VKLTHMSQTDSWR